MLVGLIVGQRDDPDLRGRLRRRAGVRCRRRRGAGAGVDASVGIGAGAGVTVGVGAAVGVDSDRGGWAAAMALSRVPPCHELLRTKSCSMFTLPTVTFVVWNTLSFRLAMMRY